MADIAEISLLVFIVYLLLTQKSRQPKFRKGTILDSCALIDGRVLDLAKAGFIADPIVIPKFILHELQLLADGADTHKRERARFGLDVVASLQHEAGLQVVIEQTGFSSISTVDDKLVALAKKLNARLYTTDFNLNKIAGLEKIKVLNVNDLAQSLRPVVLPNEVVAVKITQKGNGQDQGVGYLEDGTMIVVEGARRKVGKTVNAGVVGMHQTSAGKMAFARLKSSD